MIKVSFFDIKEINDTLLEFAVIIAKYQDKFVFCRHRQRSTWEVPGGHREVNETIEMTASRELYEESGAVDFTIEPITVYGVESDGKITYGMLFFAEIRAFDQIPPEYEIAEIVLCDNMPENLTYPQIQPKLMDYARKEMHFD